MSLMLPRSEQIMDQEWPESKLEMFLKTKVSHAALVSLFRIWEEKKKWREAINN